MTPTSGPNKRAKGEGTVYQRQSDGRWLGSVELPDRGDGKKRPRKYISGKTEGEAKAKLKALKKEMLLTNGNLPSGHETVSDWMDYWYREIASKKNKVRTTQSYKGKIDQYIKPAIGKVRLDRLTPEHVRRLHNYILSKPSARDDTQTLSSTTALQAHNILSVALKYAVREKRISENVAMLTDRPQKAEKDLSVLTAADGIKVLSTSRYDRLATRWDAALLTGARQGELLGLELDRVSPNSLDVSWQLQRITWEHGCGDKCGRSRGTDCPERHIFTPPHIEFRQLTDGLRLSRPKSKKGRRVLRLVNPLRDRIAERIEVAATEPNPHGLLWTSDPKKSKGGDRSNPVVLPLDGSPIDPSRDSAAWHELLRRAGVQRVRLHDARHTTASLLQKAGVPEAVIMQILGHSAFVTSMGYMDFDDEQLDAAMLGLAQQLSLK